MTTKDILERVTKLVVLEYLGIWDEGLHERIINFILFLVFCLFMCYLVIDYEYH